MKEKSGGVVGISMVFILYGVNYKCRFSLKNNELVVIDD